MTSFYRTSSFMKWMQNPTVSPCKLNPTVSPCKLNPTVSPCKLSIMGGASRRINCLWQSHRQCSIKPFPLGWTRTRQTSESYMQQSTLEALKYNLYSTKYIGSPQGISLDKSRPTGICSNLATKCLTPVDEKWMATPPIQIDVTIYLKFAICLYILIVGNCEKTLIALLDIMPCIKQSNDIDYMSWSGDYPWLTKWTVVWYLVPTSDRSMLFLVQIDMYCY